MSSQSEMSDAASLYRRIPPSIGALEREAAERERAAAEDRLRASRIWAKRVKELEGQLKASETREAESKHQLTTIATSLGMLDASRLIQFIGEICDPRVVSAARIQSLEIRLKEAASTSRGAVARNYDPAAPPSSVKRVRQLEAELADTSKFSAGLERQLESGRKEQEALIIALRQEVDEGRTARAQLEAEIATLTTQAQPSALAIPASTSSARSTPLDMRASFEPLQTLYDALRAEHETLRAKYERNKAAWLAAIGRTEKERSEKKKQLKHSRASSTPAVSNGERDGRYLSNEAEGSSRKRARLSNDLRWQAAANSSAAPSPAPQLPPPPSSSEQQPVPIAFEGQPRPQQASPSSTIRAALSPIPSQLCTGSPPRKLTKPDKGPSSSLSRASMSQPVSPDPVISTAPTSSASLYPSRAEPTVEVEPLPQDLTRLPTPQPFSTPQSKPPVSTSKPPSTTSAKAVPSSSFSSKSPNRPFSKPPPNSHFTPVSLTTAGDVIRSPLISTGRLKDATSAANSGKWLGRHIFTGSRPGERGDPFDQPTPEGEPMYIDRSRRKQHQGEAPTFLAATPDRDALVDDSPLARRRIQPSVAAVTARGEIEPMPPVKKETSTEPPPVPLLSKKEFDHRSPPSRRESMVSVAESEMQPCESIDRPESPGVAPAVTESSHKGKEKDKPVAAFSSKSINQEFMINPDRNQGRDHAYHEVVRKKEERRNLHAYDCACCKNYYEAVGPIPVGYQGPIWRGPPSSSPPEAHAHETDAERAARKRAEGIQAHRQATSRHRAQWEPPSTPFGYMDIGFPDTQRVEEINRWAAEKEAEKRRDIEAESRKKDGRWKRRE